MKFGCRCIISFVIGILLVLAYFVIATSFFQGWQNAKFYDDIPDLIFAIFGILIFCFAMNRTKGKMRLPLMLGALVLVIVKLAEIPMQEYQFMHNVTLPLEAWAVITIVKTLGFLLVLYAFKEGER